MEGEGLASTLGGGAGEGSERLASGEESAEKSYPETITEFCCAVSGNHVFSFLCKLPFNYSPLHLEQELVALQRGG